jgi:hypothetical protein
MGPADNISQTLVVVFCVCVNAENLIITVEGRAQRFCIVKRNRSKLVSNLKLSKWNLFQNVAVRRWPITAGWVARPRGHVGARHRGTATYVQRRNPLLSEGGVPRRTTDAALPKNSARRGGSFSIRLIGMERTTPSRPAGSFAASP